MKKFTFVSFDLDSVSCDFAPGVSCPGTIGLSSKDALDISFLSGLNSEVKLFDLSEFNPKIEPYLTGRLVVNMFYYFLLGVAQRFKKELLTEGSYFARLL
jgi:formiminoglutamase